MEFFENSYLKMDLNYHLQLPKGHLQLALIFDRNQPPFSAPAVCYAVDFTVYNNTLQC